MSNRNSENMLPLKTMQVIFIGFCGESLRKTKALVNPPECWSLSLLPRCVPGFIVSMCFNELMCCVCLRFHVTPAGFVGLVDKNGC